LGVCTKKFWEHLGKEDGNEDGPDGKLMEETIARTGAYIMVRECLKRVHQIWTENLLKADLYILTQDKKEPWVQKGTTTFILLTIIVIQIISSDKNLEI